MGEFSRTEFSYRPIEDVTDVLKEPFEIRPGIVIPPGSYHFNRPRIELASDSSKRIVLTGRYKWGISIPANGMRFREE